MPASSETNNGYYVLDAHTIISVNVLLETSSSRHIAYKNSNFDAVI